jgi:prevent-host-death family protein
MKRSSISETKNQLSALIDRVRNGESIVITDRNRPVAQLVPVAEQSGAPSDVRLATLERAGIVRRARKPMPKAVRDKAAPAVRKGSSALNALLAERRDGR